MAFTFDANTAQPENTFDPSTAEVETEVGGFKASAKQAIGSVVKGLGQAGEDFLPGGIGKDNAVKRYGQQIIDANPTAIKGLSDIPDSPWMAAKEATGNAAGSMGPMLGARALGMGITAAAPLTGPFAPATALAGQVVANVGPFVAAAMPSFGGIREKQIEKDPNSTASAQDKAVAALGAGTVGLIEGKFGPQALALKAMTKEGRAAIGKTFAETTLAKGIGYGALKGAATEGAEELVQNPIEQAAAYDDPRTPENIKDTLFGGAMGAIGGGVLGGGMGMVNQALAKDPNQPTTPPAPQPEQAPPGPAPLQIGNTPTPQAPSGNPGWIDELWNASEKQSADDSYFHGVLPERVSTIESYMQSADGWKKDRQGYESDARTKAIDAAWATLSAPAGKATAQQRHEAAGQINDVLDDELSDFQSGMNGDAPPPTNNGTPPIAPTAAPKPSEAMGLTPTAAPSLTNAAILAVDSGVSQSAVANVPVEPDADPVKAAQDEYRTQTAAMLQQQDADAYDAYMTAIEQASVAQDEAPGETIAAVTPIANVLADFDNLSDDGSPQASAANLESIAPDVTGSTGESAPAVDAKAANLERIRAASRPQPTTLGTQTNAVAGPGFGVNDVVPNQPKAQAEQAPVATNDVAKEPWKMTKNEWASLAGKKQGIYADGLDKIGLDLLGVPESQQRADYLSSSTLVSPRDDSPWIEAIQTAKKKVGGTYSDWARLAIVEKAIAEGKPVPAEVLADYPDLQPTSTPAASTQSAPMGVTQPADAKIEAKADEVMRLIGEIGGGVSITREQTIALIKEKGMDSAEQTIAGLKKLIADRKKTATKKANVEALAAKLKPKKQEAADSQKAKWIKAINDQNRLAGDTGVQLSVTPDGQLIFLGVPNATKQGRALAATLDEALNAGATRAEIIASIKAAKSQPTESTNEKAPEAIETTPQRPQAAPDSVEPELVKTKTSQGITTYVRKSDLDGDQAVIRMFTKDGKSNGRIHRENLDPAGEKQAARNADNASNPLFNVVTNKEGGAFATAIAARRALNQKGLQSTHDVVKASDVSDGATGFVIRKKAPEVAIVPVKAPEVAEAAVESKEWSERKNNITGKPSYGYNPSSGAFWATVQNPSNGVYEIEYWKGVNSTSFEEITGTLTQVKFHVQDRITKMAR